MSTNEQEIYNYFTFSFGGGGGLSYFWVSVKNDLMICLSLRLWLIFLLYI